MPRYIAYCRKSRDEADKQVLSIEAQVAEIKEFAKREHLEIIEWVTEQKTAKVPGREKFGYVIKQIERGKADGIIAWHADRLTRNSMDGGKIIYLLDTGKLLDLKFPTLWFENTPQGKFMLSIAFGQSKYYVDNLSENVARGMRQKVRNGVWPGKAPLGYTNNPKTRGIDVDPTVSRIIRRAYQMFASGGYTYSDIARFLAKHEILRKRGKPHHSSNVKRILSDRFYIGIIRYKGEYHKGSQKKIMPRELFQRVQRELERRARKPQKSHHLPFLGLATCGNCGAAVTGEEHHKYYKTTGNHQTYAYYRCTRKLKPCREPQITGREMETQIRQSVAAVAIPQAWGSIWYRELEKDEKQEKLEAATKIQKLEAELQLLSDKQNTLLDSYLEGVVDKESYQNKKQELSTLQLQLKEKIETIRANGSDWIEPMREVIDCALHAHKITREKNNSEELSFFAKRIGLNFILSSRRLAASYKKAYAAVPAPATAETADQKTSLICCNCGRYRDRTCDLYNVNVTLVPTELTAPIKK
ncbi:MAG: hypothetical protein Fur0011_4480 [Candidatus Microgenomates bacterium]